jgi:hypothetical protein
VVPADCGTDGSPASAGEESADAGPATGADGEQADQGLAVADSKAGPDADPDSGASPAVAGGGSAAPAPDAEPAASPNSSALRRQAAMPSRALALLRPEAALALLRREAVLAPLGALLLAVLMTWPTLRHPAATVPQDVCDPLVFAWILAWPGHALRTDPGALWQGNIYFPELDSFAFTDSLLGYLPFSLVGTGPEAAVVRYNLVYVLVPTIAFLGAYTLARQLGARWPGALVAGAAFAYAPWRLAHSGHLNVLSVGGMALTFAALARGHGYSFRDGYQPERVRPGWAAAGWAVGCWQLTLGFAVGLPFAYVLALVCVAGAVGWLVAGRPALPRRLWIANVAGGLALVATALLMATPYLRVAERYPDALRGASEVRSFSPPVVGLFLAPPDSWLWGSVQESAREQLWSVPEMAILPGMAVLAMAAVGLVLSSWSVRQRLALGLATLVSVLLALGSTFFGGRFTYLPLLDHAPGWDALRTPGRLVIWTTLGLGLLAAGLVTAVGDRFAQRHPTTAQAGPAPTGEIASPPRWLLAALLVPGVLVIVEGINTTPHLAVPTQPAAVRNAAGPMLVLPSDRYADMAVALWSTDGFPKVVNGSSSFNPESLAELRARTVAFPDRESVALLRAKGVRTVVVLRAPAAGTPLARSLTAPVEGLPVTRVETPDAVTFTLSGPAELPSGAPGRAPAAFTPPSCRS